MQNTQIEVEYLNLILSQAEEEENVYQSEKHVTRILFQQMNLPIRFSKIFLTWLLVLNLETINTSMTSITMQCFDDSSIY